MAKTKPADELEPKIEAEAPVEVDLELEAVKAEHPNAKDVKRVFGGMIRVDV